MIMIVSTLKWTGADLLKMIDILGLSDLGPFLREQVSTRSRLFICMVQSMDQPGRAANHARGQLNRENEYFPVSARALELGLARRVRPSRPASAGSFSTLRLNLVLTRGIPPDFRGGVHLFTTSYAIGSAPSLSGHAIAYRWRSLPRVCQHWASSPHYIVPLTGPAFSGIPMGQLMCASVLPHPPSVWSMKWAGMLKV